MIWDISSLYITLKASPCVTWSKVVVVVVIAPGSRYVVNQVNRRYLAFLPSPQPTILLSKDIERFKNRLRLL